MYSGIEIGLKEGLVVTLFSMSVVFIALLIISYMVDIMRWFLTSRNN